jgi:hypothetical protein
MLKAENILRVFSIAEVTPGVTSVMIPHLAFVTEDMTRWWIRR